MESQAKMIWDTLITISLVIIIVALIIEFFFHPDVHTLELLHTLDVIALSFLFVELVYDFYNAEDKKKFVTKEWLLILSFMPFGTVLRFSRILRLSKVLKIESIQSLVHATKITRVTRPVAQFLSKKEKQLEKMRERH